MSHRPALALLLAALLAACDTPAPQTQPSTTPPPSSRTAPAPTTRNERNTIARQALPREGQQILQQISRGGPFRYAKDGSTFGNRERHLPRQPSGYYREYTVPTPGETDRGARRIICGGQPTTSLNDCYYTADHYNTFRRIQP
ncbi:ribonuclease [Deinococcus taeanensis]|uniref:ribonuclease domain-containing protein n=1 Tax=Deinococcus taeanensis TaxID=2737050 RepID=UPI001CDC7622|nr:ribonuclease domain-containing protein [Deinococcus taeanensis]UBV41564.1 ribonuclease [Deinococcus taeanensis]